MKLVPGNILIMFDDPKFFYIIGKAYRWKRKHLPLLTSTERNYFEGVEGDPPPDFNQFEYMAWCSASGKSQWTDFKAKTLQGMRIANEEEARFIRLLVSNEDT